MLHHFIDKFISINKDVSAKSNMGRLGQIAGWGILSSAKANSQILPWIEFLILPLIL